MEKSRTAAHATTDAYKAERIRVLVPICNPKVDSAALASECEPTLEKEHGS
jgi:hypothetical protein